MSRLLDYLMDAVRRPREQLSRGQHFVRHSWDLTVHCWRQLQRHRAEGMAAELTYRTIFALIPVVVLGLVMFRIVGGLEEVEAKVENQLFSFFGVPEIPEDDVAASVEGVSTGEMDVPEEFSTDAPAPVVSSVAQTPAISSTDISGEETKPRLDVDMEEVISVSQQSGPSEAEAIESTRREARASIRRTLHEVTAKVASIDFKSIGVFGLLLFIYAAVALADSTEQLFNRLYEAPSQRPIHIRLAIHWSIITLGGGLLAMSLYMSGQVVDWFVSIGAGSTTKLILSHLLSIGASWVLLFLLYALMPNTHVSLKSAVIGSLVGALLWEAAKFGFQIYVVKAVSYSTLYGSLGSIPLFLFWMYLTWFIILFGLILTYTLQMLGGRVLSRIDVVEDGMLTGDPDWMLPIMCEVGRAFSVGQSINNQELADRVGLSGRIVHEMTGKLVDAAMLRRVSGGAGDEDSVTLARPAEKIGVGEILDVAHHVRPTNDHPAWKTLARLKRAERDAAEGKTLADVNVQ